MEDLIEKYPVIVGL